MSTFSKRIEDLKSRGFRETKAGMTNDKYAFLWHQIDIDEISDSEWEDYLLKLINTQTKSI